jgi:hypothetical protein
MKTRLLAALLCALALSAQKPRLGRAPVAAVEKIMGGRFDRADPADPLDLLVMPQGVYLPGYGAVFTAQVNLIVSPTVNPFRQEMSKPEIARVRARKLQKLPLLRQTMRDMLLGAASSLDSVPAAERIVVAVSLFHYHWEDTAGLPQQIVMQGERRALLNRTAPAIQVEEY